jgi:hypothetical protein
MPSLGDFKAAIEKKAAPQHYFRPFVCDGSPYDCKIFIVGFNPATEMCKPFWDFWKDESGFDRNMWFENYKLDRLSRPLKSGKLRRLAVSSTRRNIDRIVSGASPIKVLETNIYTDPTSTQRDLPTRSKNTGVFCFLLFELNPSVILLHGNKSRESFEEEYDCRLKPGTFAKPSKHLCAIGGNMVHIFTIPHLSRGCSLDAAEEIGINLQKLC